MISQDLAIIIQAVIEEASNSNSEFITVEHLLYGVMHDEYGAKILEGCGCNLSKLEADLKKHFKDEVPSLGNNSANVPQPTPGFQRVLERMLNNVQSAGRSDADGGDLLVSILDEEESYAVYFLNKQKIKKLDVLEYISHGGEKSKKKASKPRGFGIVIEGHLPKGMKFPPFGMGMDDDDDEDGSHGNPLEAFAQCLNDIIFLYERQKIQGQRFLYGDSITVGDRRNRQGV